MSVIKAFLSYSTKDKKIAGKIKEEFEKIGINLFLAHQDIKISKEWRKRIKTEIKESKWCLFCRPTSCLTNASRGRWRYYQYGLHQWFGWVPLLW